MIELTWYLEKETERHIFFNFKETEMILNGKLFQLKNKMVSNLSAEMNKTYGVSFNEYVKNVFGKQHCLVCGKEIEYCWSRRTLLIMKFCNRSCFSKSDRRIRERKERVCKICKKQFNLLDFETDSRKRLGTCGCEDCIKASRLNINTKIKNTHWAYTEDSKDILSRTVEKRKENDILFNRKYTAWNKGKIGIYSKEMLDKMRSNTLKQMNDCKFRKTGIEKKIEKYLKSTNYNFKYSFIFKNRQFDFVLYDFNIVIECHGDYWHGNPKYYSLEGSNNTKKLTEKQILKKKDDIIKENICTENGYKYIFFWEYDIDNNFNEVTNKIDFFINEMKGER